jgi:hypothetical protein
MLTHGGSEGVFATAENAATQFDAEPDPHCGHGDSYADQNISQGVGLVNEQFDRGYIGEGDLAVSEARIDQGEAGVRDLSSRASQFIVILEAQLDVCAQRHADDLLSYSGRIGWRQMGHQQGNQNQG